MATSVTETARSPIDLARSPIDLARSAAAFFEAFPWEGSRAPEALPAGAFLEGL